MQDIEINGWVVCPKSNCLKKEGGKHRKIGKHELNVLLILVEQVGNVVATDELLQQGWPGKIVSKSSLTQAIRNLRVCLDDNGKEPYVIKTVNRVGYTLNCEYLKCVDFNRENLKKHDEVISKYKSRKLSIGILAISITFFIYSLSELNYFYSKSMDKEQDYYLVYENNNLTIYSDIENIDVLDISKEINSLLEKSRNKSKLYLLLSKAQSSLSIVTKDGTLENYLIIHDKSNRHEIEKEIFEKIEKEI